MKKHVFLLLAVALVFALAPSLAAQSNKLTWGNRTLLGMPYREGSKGNDVIPISNVKFGKLHGGGDPNIVSINDEYGKALLDKNGKAKKTTVDKITRGNRYVINLTNNHFLEVSGTYTESGLTGNVFYVIKGGATLHLDTRDSNIKWPNVEIVIGSREVMVYYDLASFKRDIARKFVDKYIVPAVNYGEMVKMYNKTKKTFVDYQKSTGNKDKCPEYIGCTCKGDIAQHIIYCATWSAGALGGAIGALPFAAGAPAEAIAEGKKVKKNAVLVATLGYHYKWYSSEKTFKDRFRNHAMILFSEANVPSAGASLTGSAMDEMVMNGTEWFINTLAPKGLASVPGLGTVVGFAIGGLTSAIEKRQLGDRAVRFFKSK
jgi:hypothetical protein